MIDVDSLKAAEKIIETAIEQFKPSHIFGLFSGGNDSLTVTHFAAGVLGNRLTGVVHINTGIGLPETRQFVGETCERYGWKLMEYKAVDCGQVYEDIVCEYGFPGPPLHTIMYNRLKERPLRAVARDYPDGNLMFISGIRKQESVRRMRIKAGELQKENRRVWCSPFFNFSNDEISEYRDRFALVENPVRKYLCMSGECLCGAFAQPGELEEIKLWFPNMWRRIREIERKTAAAGKPWGWNDKPPEWWADRILAEEHGQVDAFQQEKESAIQMLCTTCQFKYEEGEVAPIITVLTA